MNRVSCLLSRLILPRILARACESTIPRSGKEGEKVNCFVTAVDKDSAPYLIVFGISNHELNCIEWGGLRYENERRIPLSSFQLSDFNITHYYGLSEVCYQGILDFILNRITGLPYFKIHLVRVLNYFGQYIFNKQKLITKKRMDLLKLLVERELDGETEHSPIDLMSALYSMRWVLHPQGEQQQQRVEFFLDSLVETGELTKVGYKYTVTGAALRTLEGHEEQERKHTENVKMQWRMFWLAFAVVITAIVQAGLVKLPPIIDLTK